MEMCSKAIGRLAQVGGTFSADYVEFEVKRALEWLSGDRHEGRRNAAVLVLRELALNAPTFFYQHAQAFLDNITNAIRDPKPAIREGAVEALRACFAIIAQRETKKNQYQLWYQQVYDEAKKGLDESSASTREKDKSLTREDRIHGSLLVIHELIRNSSSGGEKLRQQMEEVYGQVHPPEIASSLNMPISHLEGSSMRGSPQRIVSAVTQFEGSATNIPHSQSRYCKEFMDQRFDEVCVVVLKQRAARNFLVQHTLLTLLPQMAAFKPKIFVKKYLSDTIMHMSGSLRRDQIRSAAFEAIGLLAVAVKSDIIPHWRHWKDVLESIKNLLPSVGSVGSK
jgi:FKBP12-rapamycin complex-associated protein